MKRTNLLALAASAAVLAACGDHPFDPASAQFHHTPPEWASSTFDLHDVDDLTAAVDGNDVMLSWTSVDNYTDSDFFAPDGGDELTKWHFEVYRRDDGAAEAVWEQVADVDSCTWDGEVLSCSYVDEDLPDGEYSYKVKAFAREGSPPNHTIHHSHDSNVVSVTVGGYSIEIVGGSAADGSFNRNANNFNLTYELYYSGSLVTDCSVQVDVSSDPTASVQQHNCDGTTGERNVVFNNPSQGTSTSLEITFKVNDVTVLVVNVSS